MIMGSETPIMVLVTLQRFCARLIRRGADISLSKGCPLKVVHVTPGNRRVGGEGGIQADVLNYLYALANEAGAEMCVLTSDVAVNAMAEYAKANSVSHIIMGAGENAAGIAETLSQLLPGVEVMILEAEKE